MSKATSETKGENKRPRGLVVLALSLQGSEESEPLKSFAAAVVAACDQPAAEMRRQVFTAVEALRAAR